METFIKLDSINPALKNNCKGVIPSINSGNKVIYLKDNNQTKSRGTNNDEYQIYLDCADDGNGGDITNDGEPLKCFDEWMGS